MDTCALHKSQGNHFVCVTWNRQVYRRIGLSIMVIFWWLTFLTDLLNLATYQFWSETSKYILNLTSSRFLCVFYGKSLICSLTWHTSSETKSSQANLIYTCVVVLLHLLCRFGENMVSKSNGGTNCLRTLLPFLGVSKKIKTKRRKLVLKRRK